MTPLVQDANLHRSVRLSRDGSTFVFTMSNGDRPEELYAASADFKTVRKLTDLNPWLATRAIPKSELVADRDVDGKPLYGVLTTLTPEREAAVTGVLVRALDEIAALLGPLVPARVYR